LSCISLPRNLLLGDPEPTMEGVPIEFCIS
jgi:hypothetical protein